jgi:hypothetical protein
MFTHGGDKPLGIYMAHDKATQYKEKIHHKIHTVNKKRVFEFEKDISPTQK